MKVLSIGNSFSQDATMYLHQIARASGCQLTVANLYIGGCPLHRHYVNMLADAKAYSLEFNGYPTDFKVSISEALLSREWDYVTVQQVSSKSVNYDTYQPYLDELCQFIRKCAPKAKLVIHQTWFYEKDSHRLVEEMGYSTPDEMLAHIVKAYDIAAADVKADVVIPSGKLMMMLSNSGIEKIHRDTFHACFGISRYAIGLLWYAVLTGNSVADNTFCDFDEAVPQEHIKIAKDCVEKLVAEQ